MIIDGMALISGAGAGFDLETVRPGPGKPIRMAVVNDEVVAGTYTGPIGAADMAITHGDDQAGAEGGLDALMTVEVLAGENQFFSLPASTKRWIAITALPANAAVAVILGGDQTNL